VLQLQRRTLSKQSHTTSWHDLRMHGLLQQGLVHVCMPLTLVAFPTCLLFAACPTDPRQYKHIPEQHQLLHVVSEYLSDMNATSKKPQQLVLFQFALEHIVRISRIISTPGELCVGLRGGRVRFGVWGLPPL
jgi:hypothetical protein